MSLVRPVIEYGTACSDPCVDGKINVLDRVQTKAAQFTNHKKDSDWENLAQCRIACLCALFKACSGEWAWKAIRDRLITFGKLGTGSKEWISGSIRL